jgi:mono/diheme cytochrome c family protein
MYSKSFAFVAFLSVTACGGSKQAEPAHQAAPSDGGQSQAVADQVAAGAKLYGAHCAKCHGDQGQGSEEAPPVVGKGVFPLDPRPGAKRDVQFRTALDVFAWAKTTMPGDAPGSLPDADLIKIFAFDLTANGVKLERPLDGELAASIVLNP